MLPGAGGKGAWGGGGFVITLAHPILPVARRGPNTLITHDVWPTKWHAAFGRGELGVHMLQCEQSVHENDSDIACSTSGYFAERCACFLLSPALLHVCVVEHHTLKVTSICSSLSFLRWSLPFPSKFVPPCCPLCPGTVPSCSSSATCLDFEPWSQP